MFGTPGFKLGISSHNGVVQHYFCLSPTSYFGITKLLNCELATNGNGSTIGFKK
jgi:hypothetical protein